jgi:hypothetical protein
MPNDNTDLVSEGAEAVRDEAAEVQSALADPTENRLKQWVLLTGKRMAVAAVLLGLVFVLLVGVSFVRPYNMRDLLTETNAAKMLFSALLSGAILLVSIVVSINSVVLSQEIVDVEEQEERISTTIEYRQSIEEYVDSGVTPAHPDEFLPVILYAIRHKARAFEEVAAETADEAFREQVETFTETVETEIEQARTTLEETRFGSFKVLLAGLNYDYSGQLHVARAFQQRATETLDDASQEAITDLVETLTLFGTARGYFQSLYYKQELARLSSRLLSVSLPVIVFTSYVLLALDAQMFPETTIVGLSPLVLFVSLAYAVALAPYLVLTSYIMRATTVTLRTLAAGPFIVRRGSSMQSIDVDTAADAIDWEDGQATADD